MPDYEVVVTVPFYNVFRIQAETTEDAVAKVWGGGEGQLMDSYAGGDDESEFYSVLDLDDE